MSTIGETELIVIFLLIFLVPFILFLITQNNLLKAIKPQNRTMQPGEVWLQLIPLFNLIWHFVVVTRISDSIRNEFMSRTSDSALGLPDPNLVSYLNKRPCYDIGMAFAVLSAVSILPVLGGIASLGALVCWIIYWVKLAEFKRKVETFS